MSGADGPSPTSTTNSTSVKISKFAVKSGFVIPKNKLSGSLVPIYRDKKSAGADAATKESNKQLQRKTKWGPDPTQDAAVRKGRALAYQTRVDQIAQQVKSGKLDFDDNLDDSAANEKLDEKSLSHDSKKSKLLELEKMELIGEILKLNANYKAPPDYKPLLKEDRVTIPVKEFPGYNFIGLIFGPGGDNQKQLEKETGAKIQVYGIKPGKDKGEVIPSDANGFQGYDEIYVQVSADTFEKVDAAVSIIELLVTSVSGNLAGVSTVSADNKNIHNAASSQALTNVAPEEVSHSGSESFRAPSTGQFQYTAPWFTSVGTSMPPPSGFVPPPSSAPFNNTTHQQPPPLNPTNMTVPFGSQPLAGFNFPPQNPTLVPPRLQHPPHVNPYISQPRPSDVNAAISNQSSFPFSGSQPLQSAPFSRPLLSQQPVNPPPLSFPSGPSMQNSLPLQPNHPPPHSNFHSQLNPLPSRSLAPPFQQGHSSFSGPMQNFTPPRPSVVSAPHPNPGDFTFQPHRPHSSQNFPPGQGNRPPPHILPPPPPFRSDIHHQMQPFSRQSMLQPNRQPSFQNHGPSQPPPVHQMSRQMNYVAANPGPAFPSRPRNFMEPQQMYRGQMAPHDIHPPPIHHFRPNPSFGGPYNRAHGPGELQVYDPFSPTSVANMRPRQEDNSGTVRRRENDPEYEDLMASVGVK